MPRVQETTGGPSSLGSVLGGRVSVTGVGTSGTRPLGPHPGFAGNLGPSWFHSLPMGGAVLPPALPSPPLPGAPPSREPPRQARLWSGNFLSFQVLEMFFSSFWGRGTEGRPAGPAPLSSLSSLRGWGLCQAGPPRDRRSERNSEAGYREMESGDKVLQTQAERGR